MSLLEKVGNTISNTLERVAESVNKILATTLTLLEDAFIAGVKALGMGLSKHIEDIESRVEEEISSMKNDLTDSDDEIMPMKRISDEEFKLVRIEWMVKTQRCLSRSGSKALLMSQYLLEDEAVYFQKAILHMYVDFKYITEEELMSKKMKLYLQSKSFAETRVRIKMDKDINLEEEVAKDFNAWDKQSFVKLTTVEENLISHSKKLYAESSLGSRGEKDYKEEALEIIKNKTDNEEVDQNV